MPRKAGVAAYSLSRKAGVATFSPPRNAGVAAFSLPRKAGIAAFSLPRKAGVAAYSLSRKAGVAAYSLSRKAGVAAFSPPRNAGVAAFSLLAGRRCPQGGCGARGAGAPGCPSRCRVRSNHHQGSATASHSGHARLRAAPHPPSAPSPRERGEGTSGTPGRNRDGHEKRPASRAFSSQVLPKQAPLVKGAPRSGGDRTHEAGPRFASRTLGSIQCVALDQCPRMRPWKRGLARPSGSFSLPMTAIRSSAMRSAAL